MRQHRLINLLGLAVLCVTGCNSKPNSGDASATASYPSKAITLICPWAAGGGTDRISRFVADALQRELGQPVIVVNKTGGSGAVGHSGGALARPDGYTLTMVTFELSTMRWMGISDLTWTNFEPILQLNGDAAAILVRNDATWNTLNEFLDSVRKAPGQVKMSGTATGGAWDLARAGLLLAANLPVNSILWIPTQGAAPSLVELLGGHIDAVCCSVPEAAAQIEAGQVKVLAVMAPSRLKEYPDLKTAREQGVEWDAVGWRGLAAPKGTPRDVINRLSETCRRITQSESFQQFMSKNGFAMAVQGADEFAQFLRQQEAQWQGVIQAAGYAKK
jgi:tripartite-type tricarboxylate transporter receptor subunit TctC